jgi:hypothetical protein
MPHGLYQTKQFDDAGERRCMLCDSSECLTQIALSAQRGCTSSTAKTPDATAKGGLLTGEGADVS